MLLEHASRAIVRVRHAVDNQAGRFCLRNLSDGFLVAAIAERRFYVAGEIGELVGVLMAAGALGVEHGNRTASSQSFCQ